MDCAGEEGRAERGQSAARVAKDETQTGYKQRLVDFGARGWDGRRGGLAGGLFEDGGGVCRRAVCGSEGEVAAGLCGFASAGEISGRGCESVSLQDNGAALSRACFRADQANDEYAYRFGFCAYALQGEIAQENYRYRWPGEKGPDYASHSGRVRG